ncbi:MAG: DUF3179 domain-containing protein [Gammaproteobacteria bacterium]
MKIALPVQNEKYRRPLVLLICFLLVAIYWLLMRSSVLADSNLREAIEWSKTDFSKSIIELDEIQSGGPPKDGIPAIDDPEFISIREANSWLDAKEPVIVLEINRDVHAYPIQIMIYHEIVNDMIGGIPVSVTFCPLCNASIIFDRRVNGRVLDFGTTGKLRNSDLVMYDRQTESWWQQFNGTGLVGKYAGAKLKQFPASIVAYSDFRDAYSSAKILSRHTGYLRPYGKNPYRGYDRIGDNPFLYAGSVDPRLPAMERVVAINHNDVQRVYPFSVFTKLPVINDQVGNLAVVIFSKRGTLSALDASEITDSRLIPSATAWDRRVDGEPLVFEIDGSRFVDTKTGSYWNLFGKAISGPLRGKQLHKIDSGVHFAFAWLAFNPESEVYLPEIPLH